MGCTWLGWSRSATEYGDRRERALNDRLAALQFGTENHLKDRKFRCIRHQWGVKTDIGEPHLRAEQRGGNLSAAS
jgi:hypothetical protein